MHNRPPSAFAVSPSLLIGLVCMAAACLGRDATEPGDRRIALRVQADLSAAAVTTVVVVVTAADITTPLVFNILVANGVASGIITLPTGSARTITMHAYDANGVETHRGAVTLHIQPGTNPTIMLALTPLAGDVPIDVTLGSVVVTVAPAADTLSPAGKATLTATIVDAHGDPVLQPVTWATLNPGIATVASSGDRTAQVTGVGPGSTSVVAHFGGSAGAATIVVVVTPVFPGVEGYGTTTPAGRGGQVIRVTNLNDAGPGSLRAALTTTGPRTVIFDVSGQIDLSTELEVGDEGATPWNFLTVAGQTAPSPGITIKGTLTIRAQDVLIQHIRVRPGGGTPSRDAIQIIDPAKRVVLDHVSTSWATDENLSIFSASESTHVTDVTISNSITAEALQAATAAGGYALLIADANRVSVIRSLDAHNFDRHPEAEGQNQVLWLNNLHYNVGLGGAGSPAIRFHSAGPYAGRENKCSIIGNTHKNGPTGDNGFGVQFHRTLALGSLCYLSDNTFPVPPIFESGTGGTQVGGPPFALPSPLTVLPSGAVEAFVRTNAGARPADRDAVDTRIMNDVLNGTGTSEIYNESDVGGFPTLPQNTRVLTLPTNPNSDDDGDGYTNLEELLHALAACVEGRSTNTAQCQAWAVIP